MAISSDTRQRWALMTGLRALLMLIAGAYAIIAPGPALVAITIVGGALLLVDGILGLWSLTFGGAKTGNYWFDVVRNALSIVTGVLVLVSPFIATFVATTLIVYFIAFQAILVGVMEIVVIVREREMYARVWPVLLSGAAYVVFGVALLFAPLLGAMVMVVLGGILAIVLSLGLFGLAWRLWQASKTAV